MDVCALERSLVETASAPARLDFALCTQCRTKSPLISGQCGALRVSRVDGAFTHRFAAALIQVAGESVVTWLRYAPLCSGRPTGEATMKEEHAYAATVRRVIAEGGGGVRAQGRTPLRC